MKNYQIKVLLPSFQAEDEEKAVEIANKKTAEIAMVAQQWNAEIVLGEEEECNCDDEDEDHDDDDTFIKDLIKKSGIKARVFY